MEKIQTARLILREFQPGDIKGFYDLAFLDDVYLAGWSLSKTKAEAKNLLNRLAESQSQYAVVLKAENKIIGTVGYGTPSPFLRGFFPELKTVEAGFILLPSYRGKGYMSEALYGLVFYLFKRHAADIIFGTHKINNVFSDRLLRKAGFIYLTSYVPPRSPLEEELLCFYLTREDFMSPLQPVI